MLERISENEIDNAMKAYREDPGYDNAAKLTSVAVRWLLAKPTLPSIGPVLGILDEVSAYPPYRFSWAMRLLPWYLRGRLSEDRPGWNDYWMTRWQLSRSIRAIREIHFRVHHLTEWPEVRETAAWMASSYASQDPDFAAHLEWAQKTCPDCPRPA
jgi:hypothetical protein